MKEVFKKEHVGQEVHCKLYGNGEIVEYASDYLFCILVKFDNVFASFTTDGRNTEEAKPSLSFGHKLEEAFTYGIPKVDYKPLELGELEKAWCYVGDTEEEVLEKTTKQLAFADKNYFASLDNSIVYYWDYAMRCSDFGEEEYIKQHTEMYEEYYANKSK